MNYQEAFNKVWDRFVVQDSPRGLDEYNNGSYRGLNGSRCAVGMFIPDELYHPDMEGIATYDDTCPYLTNLHIEIGWTEKDLTFLTRLQVAHDSLDFNSPPDVCLRKVANQYGLEVIV